MKRLILIAFVALLASCASANKVRLSGPVEVEVVSSSKITLSCHAENRSAHNVTLQSVRMDLRTTGSGSSVATAMLAEPVIMPRRSVGRTEFTFRVKFTNPLMMLALAAGGHDALDPSRFTATGDAVVKSGVGRKKIHFDELPLNEILTTFVVE